MSDSRFVLALLIGWLLAGLVGGMYSLLGPTGALFSGALTVAALLIWAAVRAQLPPKPRGPIRRRALPTSDWDLWRDLEDWHARSEKLETGERRKR